MNSVSQSNINKEAKKLYDEVIKYYKDHPGSNMGAIIDEFLKKYNDEIKKQLNKTILEMMSATMAGMTMAAVPLTAPKLSKALYNNAKDVSKAASGVINEHIANKSTINDIREALYDGYGYDELLDIKKSLPKYLKEALAKAKVDKLKTKALQAAYARLLDAINDREFEAAMKVALEERARYYALRIALTEESRAFNLANAMRQKEKGVKFVKWRLSSRHKVNCICDFFANQNVGYGAGIYPLLKAPVPLYSTHPQCQCALEDYYREPEYKEDDISDGLDKFSPYEQEKALGGKSKWQEYKGGKSPLNIYKDSKSKEYPILTIGDLLR